MAVLDTNLKSSKREVRFICEIRVTVHPGVQS